MITHVIYKSSPKVWSRAYLPDEAPDEHHPTGVEMTIFLYHIQGQHEHDKPHWSMAVSVQYKDGTADRLIGAVWFSKYADQMTRLAAERCALAWLDGLRQARSVARAEAVEMNDAERADYKLLNVHTFKESQ